jgi:hypothetical protein
VRLTRLREVLNSVQALRGIPAELRGWADGGTFSAGAGRRIILIRTNDKAFRQVPDLMGVEKWATEL